jgi:hypothetical protein
LLLDGRSGGESGVRCDPGNGVIGPKPQRYPLALIELGYRKSADGTVARLAMGGSRQAEPSEAQDEA